MKYYFLYLNNNDCVNKSRIKDVKLIQSINDECIYENVEVLGYETGKFVNTHMYDVITHKEIYPDNNANGISYKSKILVSDGALKKVLEKYNTLTIDELKRYKNGLLEIERKSINSDLLAN